MEKKLIVPFLLRRVPSGNFSWIDQRLVREHYTAKMSVDAAALYLFLVIVADHQGLSYYSDEGIRKYLPITVDGLAAARRCLVQLKLVAYQRPLYQVLSLEQQASPLPLRTGAARERAAQAQPVSIGALLKVCQEHKSL